MEKNIGSLIYDSSFSRNELSSKIRRLVPYDDSIGLHGIGFTSRDKKDIAASIMRDGLTITNNLSMYRTIRFFGRLYGDDASLNGYVYDQQNPNEVMMIFAIPETFTHSSGQIIDGGEFPKFTVGEAKRHTNEGQSAWNESDRAFKPVPSELILGCYTFNRRDVSYEPVERERSIALPDGRVNVIHEIDPYGKRTLGPCDFYINPRHYHNLSQEEQDLFLEKYFGEKIKQDQEKPKFFVKRRTYPNQ